MALDFFGVFLKGWIQPRDGTDPIELWTGENDAFSGTDAAQKFKALAYVSQCNVTLRLGYTSKIQLVLTPPFEEGLVFLDSKLVQFGIGKLFVQFGYSTGTDAQSGGYRTPIFSGLMQKPDVRIGSDIAITINALGVGYAMNITGGADDPQPEFANKSWAEAVESVLEKYARTDRSAPVSTAPEDKRGTPDPLASKGMIDISGLYDDFTPQERGLDSNRQGPRVLPFFRFPPPIQGTESIGQQKVEGKQKEPAIQRGPRNDWWFVTEAVKDFGYDIFFQGNKVKVSTQSKWMSLSVNTKQKKGQRKKFLLRGEVDTASRFYPILSFNSPTTAVWMSPGVAAVAQADIDAAKNRSSEATVYQDRDNTDHASGKEGGNPKRTQVRSNVSRAPLDATRNEPGDPSRIAAREKAAGEWRKMRMEGGVTGNFTSIGIPDLAPGEVVQVGGFSPFLQGKDNISDDTHPFNGPFGVMEVRHRVGVGGFQTQFRAVSGVFNVDRSVEKGGKESNPPEEPLTRDEIEDVAGKVTKLVTGIG